MKGNRYIIISLALITLVYFYFSNNQADECNCNPYILEGKQPEIELSKDFNLSPKSKIEIKLNNTAVNFKRDGLKLKLFSKVKKTDTLQLKIDHDTFKVYDFKNYGWEQKAGKERGTFHCFLQEYKIDTVQIKHAESDKIYIYK